MQTFKTLLLREWMQHRFGWLLLGLEDVGRSANRLNTHEHTDAPTRPTLIVNYTNPEPASLTALLAGAALLLVRRR